MAAIVASCRADPSIVKIGDHQYRIPTRYIITTAAPWLPAKEKNSLIFRIFPDRNDVTVLVQSIETGCPRSADCGLADLNFMSDERVEKEFWKEGNTQWNYVNRSRNPNIQVARCFYSEGMSDAACLTMIRHGDLTLSIAYPDRRFSEIRTFSMIAKASLANWEIR